MEINKYKINNLSSQDIQNIIKKNKNTSLIRIFNGKIIVHPQIRHCELVKRGLIYNNIKGDLCFTDNNISNSFICPSEKVKDVIDYIIFAIPKEKKTITKN